MTTVRFSGAPVAILCVACILFTAACAPADPNVPANQLLLKATGFLEAAETETSPEAKLGLLQKAKDAFHEIMERHPGSDVAVALATRQSVGEISLRDLDDTIRVVTIDGKLGELSSLVPSIGDRREVDEKHAAVNEARARIDEIESLISDTNPEALIQSEQVHNLQSLSTHVLEVERSLCVESNVPTCILMRAVAAAHSIRDTTSQVMTLANLALAFAASEDAVRARDALDNATFPVAMLGIGSYPEDRKLAQAIGRMASAYAALDDVSDEETRTIVDAAVEAANAIQNPVERARALVGAASIQVKAGDLSGAGQTLGQATSAIDAIEDSLSKAELLARLSVVSATVGDAAGPNPNDLLDRALTIAESIDSPHARLAAFRNIATAQASTNDTNGARKNFAEAVAVARTVELRHGRAYRLAQLALLQANAGLADEARKTASEAIAAAEEFSPDGFSVDPDFWLDIASAQARTGDTASAQESIKKLAAVTLNSERLARLASVQANMNEVEKARTSAARAVALAEKTEWEDQRSRSLVAVSAQLAQFRL